MSTGHSLLKAFGIIGLSFILGMSVNANAGIFGIGSDSWMEEVLLHNGQKIIVERSQTYGGEHEIGQPLPIKEHSIKFNMPDSNKVISWTSEYSVDIGRTNFNLLAVHVLNGTPYIVASPNLCLSYNKWGRPNPPYVFFKFDGNAWQRIPLEQFPVEFKTNNVAFGVRGRDVEELVSLRLVSTEKISELNRDVSQPEYKIILREPIANAGGSCGAMVYDGHGGWIGIGWFKKQPSREACLKICEREKIVSQYCPCETIFEAK